MWEFQKYMHTAWGVCDVYGCFACQTKLIQLPGANDVSLCVPRGGTPAALALSALGLPCCLGWGWIVDILGQSDIPSISSAGLGLAQVLGRSCGMALVLGLTTLGSFRGYSCFRVPSQEQELRCALWYGVGGEKQSAFGEVFIEDL